MRIQSVVGSALLGLVGIYAVDADAATFESAYALIATSEANGTVDTDTVGVPDTTASSGVTTTKGNSPDTITAQAMQNRGGQSRVEVDVECFGVSTLACGGYRDETKAKATAERFSFQLLDGVPSVNGGTFDFQISGVRLAVLNGGNFFEETSYPEATVRFNAQIFIGDGSNKVDEFNAFMTLSGRYNDFRIEEAQGFSGAVQRLDCFADTCTRGVVDADVLTGSLSFGPVLFGQELIIYTKLEVESIFDGTERGASARAFDPNGTVVSALTFQDAPTVVPLPGSGVLLTGALAAAAMLGKRRRG